MNQEQFLQELSKALKPLSEEERNEILFDFEEHITKG
ncbi:HAAS signaling domain-containing protein [Bacillus spizizenii]